MSSDAAPIAPTPLPAQRRGALGRCGAMLRVGVLGLWLVLVVAHARAHVLPPAHTASGADVLAALRAQLDRTLIYALVRDAPGAPAQNDPPGDLDTVSLSVLREDTGMRLIFDARLDGAAAWAAPLRGLLALLPDLLFGLPADADPAPRNQAVQIRSSIVTDARGLPMQGSVTLRGFGLGLRADARCGADGLHGRWRLDGGQADMFSLPALTPERLANLLMLSLRPGLKVGDAWSNPGFDAGLPGLPPRTDHARVIARETLPALAPSGPLPGLGAATTALLRVVFAPGTATGAPVTGTPTAIAWCDARGTVHRLDVAAAQLRLVLTAVIRSDGSRIAPALDAADADLPRPTAGGVR